MMRDKLASLFFSVLDVFSMILFGLVMAATGFGLGFLVNRITTTLAMESEWPYLPFVFLLAINAIHSGINLADKKMELFGIFLIMSYATGLLFYVNLQMGNMADISKIFLLFICLLYASFHITDRRLKSV